MHVAIDIDGTLSVPPAEFEFPTCEEWLKDHNFAITKRDYTKLKAIDAFGLQKAVYKKWFDYYFPINCKKVPVEPGAPEAVRIMKRRGYKVSIVTRRDKNYDGAYTGVVMAMDTEHWLLTNDIPYDAIHYGCSDKASVLREIGADIMIEDEPMNLENMAKAKFPCIAIARTYNEEFQDYSPLIVRKDGWPSIIDFLTKFEAMLSN